jgi:hypothetical protein
MSMNTFDYEDFILAKKETGINIETTFRCRLQCPACQRHRPIGNWKMKVFEDISVDNWRKLLSFHSKTNARWHKLCGQISDPIYHPNLIELFKIRNIEYPHVPIEVNTNGSGKKWEFWENIFPLCEKLQDRREDRWHFALDGTDNETLNKYRIGSNFDDVYKVLEYSTKFDIKSVWHFIVFEHNKHQLPKAKQLAKDLNITFRETWTTRDTPEVPAAKEAFEYQLLRKIHND